MMEQQWIRQDRSNAEPGGKLKANPTPSNRNKGLRRDISGGENPTPGRGAAAGTPTIKRAFENADKNGDGKLSVEEYFRPENFSKADSNGDGAVTLEETPRPNSRRGRQGRSKARRPRKEDTIHRPSRSLLDPG